MSKFLVADENTSLWGHIFPDQRERMTRFVFEMETALLLAVQIETGPVAGWRDATPPSCSTLRRISPPTAHSTIRQYGISRWWTRRRHGPSRPSP